MGQRNREMICRPGAVKRPIMFNKLNWLTRRLPRYIPFEPLASEEEYYLDTASCAHWRRFLPGILCREVT